MQVFAKDTGGCDYLTAGKMYNISGFGEYSVTTSGRTIKHFGGYITCDKGDGIFICLKASSHINYNDWELVNDKIIRSGKRLREAV